MADDPIPFVLAGKVVSWDPATRVLHIGLDRLDVAPGVDTTFLTPSESVTVTGYRAGHPSGLGVVTGILDPRPRF
jgi:hypothetical protein